MTLHTVTPATGFAPANANVQPGDEVRIGDGVYYDGPLPAASGLADAPIVYYADGENITIHGKINFANRAHVHMRGANQTTRFHSRSAQWVTTNDASAHYSVEGCRFTAEWQGNAFNSAGILIRGLRPRFVGNKLDTWYGMDALQWWSDYGLYRDIDLSECNNGHGLWLYGNYNIFTGRNPVRNRWARAGGFVGRGTRGARNVIEGFEITDSGWDTVTPVEGWALTGDGPGDQQLLQLGGDGTIFRRNQIHHNHQLMRDPYSYAAMIQFANYVASSKEGDTVTHFEHFRAYDNAIYDNPLPAYSASYNPNLPMYAEDMRVWTGGIDGEVIRHNAIPTLQLLEGTYAPQVQTVSGDVVTLDDAWGLTDGNGVEGYAGDELTVWGQAVRVVEWIDGTTVRVSPLPVWEEPAIVVMEPEPAPQTITISIQVPAGVTVNVNVEGASNG